MFLATLSETRVGPSEKFLPPNSGERGIMLAWGPEGGIGGPYICDKFSLIECLLCAQSHAKHL